MITINELNGDRALTPAAFADPSMHDTYLVTHFTTCDCHSDLFWEAADLVVHRNGVINCPLT